MKKLEIEELKQFKSGDVFARGITTNAPCGVYMTDDRYEETLVWVAKKGYGYDDWAIYCGFYPTTEEHVIKNGQKVISKENIKKLVPCTDEVFSRYRF